MSKKKNIHAKKQLIALYGARCMLTNIQSDYLTYHHCLVKKEHGGESSADNGANLIDSIHSWLHCEIETHDNELYWLINECMCLYKQCMDKHNEELIEEYEKEIMPLFVKEHIRYKCKRR